MSEFDICISFIVAILGVAYPIILESVTTLDDKYNTNDIVNYFGDEIPNIFFRIFLYTDLIVVAFSIIGKYFKIYKIINIENYVIYIVICLTIGLVFSFISLINKLLVYYNKDKLIKYIIEKDKKYQKERNYQYFSTISDILAWSIQNDIPKIPETINEYINSCFYNYKQEDSNKNKDFPKPYYEFVYRIMRELLIKDSQRYTLLENSVIGGNWLLGGSTKIGKETYKYLWYNLLFSVKNGNDNAVMNYWTNAFQYFQYALPKINNEYGNRS